MSAASPTPLEKVYVFVGRHCVRLGIAFLAAIALLCQLQNWLWFEASSDWLWFPYPSKVKMWMYQAGCHRPSGQEYYFPAHPTEVDFARNWFGGEGSEYLRFRAPKHEIELVLKDLYFIHITNSPPHQVASLAAEGSPAYDWWTPHRAKHPTYFSNGNGSCYAVVDWETRTVFFYLIQS